MLRWTRRSRGARRCRSRPELAARRGRCAWSLRARTRRASAHGARAAGGRRPAGRGAARRVRVRAGGGRSRADQLDPHHGSRRTRSARQGRTLASRPRTPPRIASARRRIPSSCAGAGAPSICPPRTRAPACATWSSTCASTRRSPSASPCARTARRRCGQGDRSS